MEKSLEASIASKEAVEKLNAEVLAERRHLESLLKETQAQVDAMNAKVGLMRCGVAGGGVGVGLNVVNYCLVFSCKFLNFIIARTIISAKSG